MNTDQAKEIDFPKLLSKLGFEPVKISKSGSELWYNSPLRSEKTASFHTSFLGGKWIWKDFGDIGGTVIDFIMRYQNSDVKDALAFLEGRVGAVKNTIPTPLNLNFGTDKSIPSVEAAKKIFTLKEIKNFGSDYSLSEYIISNRGIDQEIAKQFLKEIHFVNNQNGKHYFAAGLKNTEGGYEIRNPFFKSTVPETSKSMSFVKMGEDNKEIICFEGFIDFLSYGTLFGLQSHQNYLVLNTVSFVKEAAQMIKSSSYSKILTFFDNDKAGQEATEYFKIQLPNVQSQNVIYANDKDLNAFLIRFKQSEIKK